MARESSILVKVVVFLVLMGFAVIYMAWVGVQKAQRPNEAQRVEVRTGASSFSGWQAYDRLKEIVAIGPRVAGSAGGEKVREIIRRDLKKAGLLVEEFPFQGLTPGGARDMVNLIGVVEGSEEGVIVLGTHYDTKYLPDIEFVGANDGGSTTAWMLEFAKVIGPQRRGRTLWLCFFDGEEAVGEWSDTDSLYGSRALVETLEGDGRLSKIEAMVNVDMIGDCFLGIYRDSDAPKWLMDAVWGAARELGYEAHFSAFGQAMEDDHIPFRRAGIPALNLIDFRYGGSLQEHRQNWHTANDTLERVCPESLQAVGDVLYHALPDIDGALERMGGG